VFLFCSLPIEEFDMEEALTYCFNFTKETSATWLRLKKQSYTRLMRFQKQIFPEKITFDGEKFGTTKLALFYKINQESGANKSAVVTQGGRNWNRTVASILSFPALTSYRSKAKIVKTREHGMSKKVQVPKEGL
jgi:hypothetical protein